MQRYTNILFSALLLSAAVSAPAISAGRTEAKLVAAVSAPRQVIIDGKLWSCEGQTCTSNSTGDSQPIRRECSRAARVLGPVAAYTRDGKALDAAGIAACNASAAG